MNSNQILQAALKNDRAIFIDTLKSLSLVDIGTIVSVKDGRALVHGSSFVGGRQTIYQNAEIVYPGNDSGVFSAACAGTACLIFTPMSCMVNTETRVINFAAPPYDPAGVKVLPIGNGHNNPITVRFDEEMYRIMTDTYSAVFKEDSLGIFRQDATSSIEIDTNGDIHVVRQGQSDSYIQDITDSNAHIVYKQSGKQWDIEVSEGKLTLTQTANNQQTCSIVVDETGKVKIDAKEIDLNGDSKRLVTYGELKTAMDKLWVAMTTTPIAGNGALQPSWTGLDPITGIDISAAETQSIKTGG